MKSFILLVMSFLLLLVFTATGQEARRSLHYLSGQIYGGQIQVHSSKIEHFRGINPYGAGLDYSWKFVSEDAYALCQCYPSLGTSLNYWNFGNKALGHAVSALFYVEPVLFSPFDIDISLKSGLGVSYLDNPYDEESNPRNVTYSTHFSFPLMVGLSFTRPLNNEWALRVSGIFQHISNGGTNQPNLGINYTTIGLGLQRKLSDRTLPESVDLEPFTPDQGEREVFLSLITGLKEPVEKETKSLVLSLSGEYMHQFARINAWTAGAMLELDDSRDVTTRKDKSRGSLMAGHTFLLGRFSFAQKAGLYLWTGHSTHAPWFQYYTLDFSATENLGIGVGLKAHGKVAEFLGVRLLFTL